MIYSWSGFLMESIVQKFIHDQIFG